MLEGKKIVISPVKHLDNIFKYFESFQFAKAKEYFEKIKNHNTMAKILASMYANMQAMDKDDQPITTLVDVVPNLEMRKTLLREFHDIYNEFLKTEAKSLNKNKKF